MSPHDARRNVRPDAQRGNPDVATMSPTARRRPSTRFPRSIIQSASAPLVAFPQRVVLVQLHPKMRAQVATAVVPTLLALALVSRPTAAQVDPWGSQIFPDPLRFNSLPLEPSQAVVPPAGEWQISAASGYFNVWQTTWHTGATHRDPALVGKPLTEAELRLLETNFPHDQFYFIDVEGWREDLSASVGLGDGYALTGRVPWIHIGGPVWDTIAEDFHRIFGLSDQRRNLFSHGQTVVYARGNHGKIEHWAEENGSGLGDSSLAVTGPLGHWL
ncbi:MAG: DUF3187 family protein, partial [Thermoanaerobaculales bacterium]